MSMLANVATFFCASHSVSVPWVIFGSFVCSFVLLRAACRAMLEEDRTALFSGDDDMLGSRIVGSSVAQVSDQDARDLFWMMAVVAEDVPVPMPVLELLWCAHRDVEPPLGRLGMMKLRRHVFVLLDRNLVLGESTVSLVCPRAQCWKSHRVAAHPVSRALASTFIIRNRRRRRSETKIRHYT